MRKIGKYALLSLVMVGLATACSSGGSSKKSSSQGQKPQKQQQQPAQNGQGS